MPSQEGHRWLYSGCGWLTVTTEFVGLELLLVFLSPAGFFSSCDELKTLLCILFLVIDVSVFLGDEV